MPSIRVSTSGERRRYRRDRRPEHPRPMRETANDRQIVHLVHHYRLLSQNQLERLLGKSRSQTQRSLIRLYHHRYLQRQFLPVWFVGRSPTLYTLDQRGRALLQGEGVVDFSDIPYSKRSALFLEHTLAINEVRLAVTRCCEEQGGTVSIWLGENEIKADYDRVLVTVGPAQARRLPVVPDSYFHIQMPEQAAAHFFLELDRGTMTQRRFVNKMRAYIAYYKSGEYEKRFQSHGFRVLTVIDTPGRRRLEHLLHETSALPGIGRRFWFAHLSDLKRTTVLTDPIWQVAGSNTGIGEALFSQA